MQGIAALGYEVQELPLVPEGGIQEYEHAANLLAEFGRNGDTYIVHAAEGETMVPMEVLENNPRLKDMLFAQMEEMGIEPERYIVGNELNSINPITGQAEFFFKKIFKKVKKAVKKVAKVAKKIAPIVLPIVAPFLLPAMPLAFATGIGSLAGGLIAGQDFKTAARNAVITGGLAGLGNLAFGGTEGFGSGSFFGSRAAPSQGLGTFSFKQAVTPVNPLSQAGQAQLAALRTQAAQQAGGTGIDFTGEKIEFPDSQNLSDRVGDERSLFEKAKDKFTETFSPNRPSIQPSAEAVGQEAARIAQGDIAAAEATKSALEAAGLPAPTIDTTAIVADATKAARANLAPSFIEKFGPATALGTAGAVAADAATGGAILGIFTDSDGDGLDDTTGYTSEEYQQMFPEAFFDPEEFYGNNPYYRDQPVTTLPVVGDIATVAQGGEIVGPGTPTSDSIPALLSDGEFVMNAAAVRGAGGGDRKEGAKRMYAMMRDFERRA
tara:strand:+ start:695 stop:2173 length:1479 start_codon:yes stop_codon:yes gene_type:complete